MSDFEILKNCPLESTSKYPFREMEVGDSFIVPLEHKVRVRSAGFIFGRRNNVKFTIRTINGRTQIWRIK